LLTSTYFLPYLSAAVRIVDSDERACSATADTAVELYRRTTAGSFEIIKAEITCGANVKQGAGNLSSISNDNSLVELLCSIDGNWILALRNVPYPHLVSCFRNGSDKQKYVSLSNKILSEIRGMCDMAVDGTWTIDPFKANYYWGALVSWSSSSLPTITFQRFLKMGIEIETSVIKIRPSKGTETYMMDIFTSKQAPWSFTSDTLDNSLQSSTSKWMNSESKTFGGRFTFGGFEVIRRNDNNLEGIA
jgi:hypothetical protein